MPLNPNTVDRTCESCGVTFQVHSYKVKVGRGRFCSKSCKSRVQMHLSNSHFWKGGRQRSKEGYIYAFAKDHPRADRKGRVLEHRLVAETTIGRYLSVDEIVHHINGLKDDNRPDNLQVMSRMEHGKLHGWASGWSRNHTSCTQCGTVSVRHEALGLCLDCYRRRYRASKRQQIETDAST